MSTADMLMGFVVDCVCFFAGVVSASSVLVWQ